MLVENRTSKGIEAIPIETKLLALRDIYLWGEITDETVLEITKQITYLVRENGQKPIRIWLNSPGGAIVDGMVIYDLLTGIRDTPIYMIAAGKCYSMGGLLFAAGQRGRRLMLPNSELMLHEPLVSSRIGGSSSTVKSLSESLLETRRKVNEILARHTARSVEEVEEATSYDHYFSAEEAIEFGLADRIVSYGEIMGGAYE